MANIVRHSYVDGRNKAKKIRSHLNYLQYRPGDDLAKKKGQERTQAGGHEKDRAGEQRDGPGREFIVPTTDPGKDPGEAVFEFKSAFDKYEECGKVIHKFILSPERQDVNMNEYTREIMQSIGQQKGQDLRYGFVIHDNTDNIHAHVIVLGKDLEGHNVRFGKSDHSLMRYYGDRYLERTHGQELSYSHEIEMYARTHGHNLYMSGREHNDRFLRAPDQKSFETDEDFRRDLTKKRDGTYDYLLLNKNWKESLEGATREGDLSLGYSQQHARGRLVEFHDLYQNTQDRQTWQDVLNNSSDVALKEKATVRLSELDEQRAVAIADLQERTGLRLDKPGEFEKFIAGIQEQFALEFSELDATLHPEKYEPKFPDVLKDRGEEKERVPIEMKDGRVLTPYDSLEKLIAARNVCRDGQTIQLGSNDLDRLSVWIDRKSLNEDCYGSPPEKKIEQETRIEHSSDTTTTRMESKAQEDSNRISGRRGEFAEIQAVNPRGTNAEIELWRSKDRPNPELAEIATIKPDHAQVFEKHMAERSHEQKDDDLNKRNDLKRDHSSDFGQMQKTLDLSQNMERKNGRDESGSVREEGGERTREMPEHKPEIESQRKSRTDEFGR